MSDQPKRSLARAWEALEKWALRDEAERVAATSDEELDASLAEEGVDAKAAREKTGGGGRGRRSVAWTIAAAVAAVAVFGGGGAAIVVLNAPQPMPSTPVPTAPEPHGPPAPAPTVVARREAEDLRKLAKADCNAEAWGDCLAKLDRANDLDPRGNLRRGVQRMRKEANRAHIAEQSELRPVTERAPRSLDTEQRLWLFTALRGDSGGAGVRLQLACATAQEPAQFCEQLAAVMKKAGWTVTRAKLAAADAGAVRAQRIEVATDADEGTQAAADALADALERDGIIAKGPADAAPDGQLPSLRVTVQ